MEENQPIVDVPTQIFEKFMGDLKEAGIDEEVITSLRTTIVEKRNLTETAMNQAMFPLKRQA